MFAATCDKLEMGNRSQACIRFGTTTCGRNSLAPVLTKAWRYTGFDNSQEREDEILTAELQCTDGSKSIVVPLEKKQKSLGRESYSQATLKLPISNTSELKCSLSCILQLQSLPFNSMSIVERSLCISSGETHQSEKYHNTQMKLLEVLSDFYYSTPEVAQLN